MRIIKGPLKIPYADRSIVQQLVSNMHTETQEAPKFKAAWALFDNLFCAYWARPGGSERDKFTHLAENSVMQDAYNLFTPTHEARHAIDLPLLNRNGHNVPVSFSPGKYTASSLSLIEFIEVSYEIRNGLVHGRRGAASEEEKKLVKFASGFSSFIKLLMERFVDTTDML